MPDPEKKTEGGDKPKETPAPANYHPLSVKNRQDWNNFLDYLSKEGVGGKPELDKRDQTLGLSYLDKYAKANPGFSITPDMIGHIQYEQQMLRRGSSFPTLDAQQLQVIRQHLQPAYINRQISPVDNWLGSLTSRQWYPKGSIGVEGQPTKDYGEDIETYANRLLNR